MSKSFAEVFLGQIREAMSKTNLLEKQLERKDKWTAPKLVPDKREWEVDEEEFKQFETVINFLRLALFGECNRSKLVQFYLLDRSRYQTVLPHFHVPKTPMEATEREVVEALDCAQANAGDAQRLVEMLQKNLQRMLQRRYRHEDRRAKAKGCEACDGQGWVRDEKAFEALERYDRSRAQQELGGYNKVFCSCQERTNV